MAEELQLPGGGFENEKLHVAPERSLRVDEDNDNLRLHDGSTPGGKIIPNLDQLSTLFQEGNVELDGFNFSAASKGFLARVAAGQYALRTFTVNGQNLTIANPLGTAGNPLISLQATILSNHTWGGVQTFSQPIVGDLDGNVEGDVLGDVVGNLDGNADGDHTGTFTGDVDVQGFELLLDDGQIPASKVDLPDVPTVIHPGMGMFWFDILANIPDGWYVCDGDNGTPDLRDKFIVCSGGTYTLGSSGGAATHTHVIEIEAAGVHSHTVTVDGHALTTNEIPSHSHRNGVTDGHADRVFNRGANAVSPATPESIDNNSDDGIYEGNTSSVGGGAAHTHTASSGSAGSHTHAASSQAGSNIPPYYAIPIIMFTGA